MPDLNDRPEEEVRRKVEYERVSTSGTSRQAVVTIVIIAVIALALIAWILMHLHH
ncbi:MAG TPA: hypothetical protein VJ853_04340 [Thermoanaerobaculia bacterium]|nr:hypothetical protein [Thermoanaerobaculia bacterium]